MFGDEFVSRHVLFFSLDVKTAHKICFLIVVLCNLILSVDLFALSLDPLNLGIDIGKPIVLNFFDGFDNELHVLRMESSIRI
jgi:hypothetical protein